MRHAEESELDEEDAEEGERDSAIYVRTPRRSHAGPGFLEVFPFRLFFSLSLFLALPSSGWSSSFLPLVLPLRRAPSYAKYAAESLYHHGRSNNRGLTVPAIYCGHIFILTLIATWYRPRA